MKILLAGLLCTAAALSFTAQAEAAGCIKGAIVGGVAGHMAGHGKMGAAAGCAIGHHHAAKMQKQQDAAPASDADATDKK